MLLRQKDRYCLDAFLLREVIAHSKSTPRDGGKIIRLACFVLYVCSGKHLKVNSRTLRSHAYRAVSVFSLCM